jgi:hypothetical protein
MKYTTIQRIATVLMMDQSTVRKACQRVGIEKLYGRYLLKPLQVRQVVAILHDSPGRPPAIESRPIDNRDQRILGKGGYGA